MSQRSAAHIHCNQIMSSRQACLRATVHSVCSGAAFLVYCWGMLFFSVIACLIAKNVVEGVESRSVAHPHTHLNIPEAEIKSWKNEIVGS